MTQYQQNMNTKQRSRISFSDLKVVIISCLQSNSNHKRVTRRLHFQRLGVQFNACSETVVGKVCRNS